MKRLYLLLIFIISASSYSWGQVVNVTLINTKTKADINAMFGMSIFKCGVSYYKMTYNSVDAKGNADILSGLLVIPDDADATYPILIYEHGTSDCKTCVPSRYEQTGGDEGQAGVLFGGMGYISLLPDYVGMGDGAGFQTYVHDSTIISATKDMLDAFKSWAPSNNIHFNSQLFITGYSQGGYASMGFHKYMQEKYGESSVTAATHNSGPYSLSGVMRDLILTDSAYAYPAYIPNTMLGMNEVYGIYNNLSDFFKPEYVPDIQKYYDGQIHLTDLNQRLLDTLAALNTNPYAHYMIKDSIFDSIANRPNYIINRILKYNDVYNWQPKSPTRIFYCKADDQVPYRNAVVAIDTMYALGADPNLVKTSDLDPTKNHTGCVQPAFTQTIFFFANYQQSTLGVNQLSADEIQVYPSPANNILHFKGIGIANSTVTIFDLNGKKLISNLINTEDSAMNVNGLSNGIYIIQFETEDGRTIHQKFSVER